MVLGWINPGAYCVFYGLFLTVLVVNGWRLLPPRSHNNLFRNPSHQNRKTIPSSLRNNQGYSVGVGYTVKSSRFGKRASTALSASEWSPTQQLTPGGETNSDSPPIESNPIHQHTASFPQKSWSPKKWTPSGTINSNAPQSWSPTSTRTPPGTNRGGYAGNHDNTYRSSTPMVNRDQYMQVSSSIQTITTTITNLATSLQRHNTGNGYNPKTDLSNPITQQIQHHIQTLHHLLLTSMHIELRTKDIESILLLFQYLPQSIPTTMTLLHTIIQHLQHLSPSNHTIRFIRFDNICYAFHQYDLSNSLISKLFSLLINKLSSNEIVLSEAFLINTCYALQHFGGKNNKSFVTKSIVSLLTDKLNRFPSAPRSTVQRTDGHTIQLSIALNSTQFLKACCGIGILKGNDTITKGLIQAIVNKASPTMFPLSKDDILAIHPQRIQTVCFGLKDLDGHDPNTKALVRIIAKIIMQTTITFTPRALSSALYGLIALDGHDDNTKLFVRALLTIAQRSTSNIPLETRDIGMMGCSLRNLDSNDSTTMELVSYLANSMESTLSYSKPAYLDRLSLDQCLSNIYHLDGKHPITRRYIQAIVKKIHELNTAQIIVKWTSLSIANMFKGLTPLNRDDPVTEELLEGLADLMERSKPVVSMSHSNQDISLILNPADIATIFRGISRFNCESKAMIRLIGLLDEVIYHSLQVLPTVKNMTTTSFNPRVVTSAVLSDTFSLLKYFSTSSYINILTTLTKYALDDPSECAIKTLFDDSEVIATMCGSLCHLADHHYISGQQLVQNVADLMERGLTHVSDSRNNHDPPHPNRMMTSDSIGRAVFGIVSQYGKAAKANSTKALVTALAKTIELSCPLTSDATPILTAFDISKSLYALQHLDGFDSSTRRLVDVLASRIAHTPTSSRTMLTGQMIGNALFGLKNLRIPYEETIRLIQALLDKIEAYQDNPQTVLHSLDINEACTILRHFVVEGMTGLGNSSKKPTNPVSQEEGEADREESVVTLYRVVDYLSNKVNQSIQYYENNPPIDGTSVFTNAQDVSMTLYSLQYLDGKRKSTQRLVSLLAKAVDMSEYSSGGKLIQLDGNQFTRCLCGLQNLQGNHHSTIALTKAIASKISPSLLMPINSTDSIAVTASTALSPGHSDEFSVSRVRTACHSISSLAANDPSTYILVHALSEAIRTCTPSTMVFRTGDTGYALLGLSHLDHEHPATQAMIRAILPKIEGSIQSFDAKDLFLSCFALQGIRMTQSSTISSQSTTTKRVDDTDSDKVVKRLIHVIANKISTATDPKAIFFQGSTISKALYGLCTLDSRDTSVQELLDTVIDKIETTPWNVTMTSENIGFSCSALRCFHSNNEIVASSTDRHVKCKASTALEERLVDVLCDIIQSSIERGKLITLSSLDLVNAMYRLHHLNGELESTKRFVRLLTQLMQKSINVGVDKIVNDHLLARCFMGLKSLSPYESSTKELVQTFNQYLRSSMPSSSLSALPYYFTNYDSLIRTWQGVQKLNAKCVHSRHLVEVLVAISTKSITEGKMPALTKAYSDILITLLRDKFVGYESVKPLMDLLLSCK